MQRGLGVPRQMSGYHDHVDAEIDRLGRAVDEAGDRAAAQLARGGPVVGEASSGDNAITVSVSPGGMLRDVRISQSALTMGPEALADELMRLAGRATNTANARMHQSLRPVLDAGTARGLEQLGMAAADTGGEDDTDGYGRPVLGRWP